MYIDNIWDDVKILRLAAPSGTDVEMYSRDVDKSEFGIRLSIFLTISPGLFKHTRNYTGPLQGSPPPKTRGGTRMNEK